MPKKIDPSDIPAEIPRYLESCKAELQLRTPAMGAKCSLAGCKDAKYVYKEPKTKYWGQRTFALCEKHAILWGDWQGRGSSVDRA